MIRVLSAAGGTGPASACGALTREALRRLKLANAITNLLSGILDARSHIKGCESGFTDSEPLRSQRPIQEYGHLALGESVLRMRAERQPCGMTMRDARDVVASRAIQGPGERQSYSETATVATRGEARYGALIHRHLCVD